MPLAIAIEEASKISRGISPLIFKNKKNSSYLHAYRVLLKMFNFLPEKAQNTFMGINLHYVLIHIPRAKNLSKVFQKLNTKRNTVLISSESFQRRIQHSRKYLYLVSPPTN